MKKLPEKGVTNMKGKIITILLALVFIGSAGMFAYSRLEAQRSLEAQKAAEEMAKAEAEKQKAEQEETAEEGIFAEDSHMAELKETDLAVLREVNPDVLGWIVIPDTQLEYPLMDGEDNQYYLEHTWDRKYNSAGSIFLEKTSSSDLSDYHTVIYGHRMNNGSMFGSLGKYTTLKHWEDHPYVYIVDDNGVHRYKIFAAYEANIGSRTYQVGFSGEESKEAFLEHCLTSSVIDTGVVPTTEEKILTLSTCTSVGHNNLRWVVQARFEGTAE